MPEVAIDLIKPSPYQPRLTFEIGDLKEEIQRDGLLSALVVRKRDAYYELLDGERRLRTLKELGWKMVPVDVREVDDRTARRSVFKLNKIRESYNTEEEARYFKTLADEGRTAWEVSQELNVNFNWVLAHLNVFKFPEQIQKAVWEGKYLTVSHMRHVLQNVIERNFDEALAMASEIINRNLSVADARKIVSDRDKEADEQRLEAAKGALPEVVGTLETPEDYDTAARALRERGKRMRREAMTPEELLKEEGEKQGKKREREEKKRQAELRLLEAGTVETSEVRDQVETAKAKVRELTPQDKKTELEEVLATSDLSVGVLERLPAAITAEPDRPIIEIARELHLEATPGIKKPPARGPKPEPLLTDWVSEVTKTGYSLVDFLDKMMAGDFSQVAPRIELLRIDEMLSTLQEKIRKYTEGKEGKGESNA